MIYNDENLLIVSLGNSEGEIFIKKCTFFDEDLSDDDVGIDLENELSLWEDARFIVFTMIPVFSLNEVSVKELKNILKPSHDFLVRIMSIEE